MKEMWVIKTTNQNKTSILIGMMIHMIYMPQKLPLLGPTCCLLLICWHMFLIVLLSCEELSSQQNYSNCLWLRICMYFAFYGVQLCCCRRQPISSYESIQSCALPEPTVLSVLCQAITTTTINNLRAYSAIKQKWRLITQIPRLAHLYHHGKISINTYMCLHITFENLAVPEKLSNTSIQQPIKGFNIWCYACRRGTFHYNGFTKYIMHRTCVADGGDVT